MSDDTPAVPRDPELLARVDRVAKETVRRLFDVTTDEPVRDLRQAMAEGLYDALTELRPVGAVPRTVAAAVSVVAANLEDSISEFVAQRVDGQGGGFEADPTAAARVAVEALDAAGYLARPVGTAPAPIETDIDTPPLIASAVRKLRVYVDEHDDDEIEALLRDYERLARPARAVPNAAANAEFWRLVRAGYSYPEAQRRSLLVRPDTVRPTGPDCYAEAVGMPQYCAGEGCKRDECFPPDTVRPDDEPAEIAAANAARIWRGGDPEARAALREEGGRWVELCDALDALAQASPHDEPACVNCGHPILDDQPWGDAQAGPAHLACPEGPADVRSGRYSVTFDDLFRVPEGWPSWRCLLNWTRQAPGYLDGACRYDHNVDSEEQLAAETAEHLTHWHPHVHALAAVVPSPGSRSDDELRMRYADLVTAATALVRHPTADRAGLETAGLHLASVLDAVRPSPDSAVPAEPATDEPPVEPGKCWNCGGDEITYQSFSAGREYWCPQCEESFPYRGQAPPRVQMLADGRIDELKAQMREELERRRPREVETPDAV